MPRTLRGDGALSVDQQEQVIQMVKSGATYQRAAERFTVSRNTVAGVWARFGDPVPRHQPTTLGQRLDALHAQLDRVLAETTGVGRIPEPKPEPRR